MKVKSRYKKTELGVIPEDWNVVKLNDVCSMKSGEGITSADIDDFSKYPCFGGNGLRGYTSRFTHDGTFALIGRQGALCGNIFRTDGKFFASEHAVVVSPNEKNDVSFLTYVLDQMNLNQYSESSAQPGLSVSKILNLQLIMPSSKIEQRAIATVLEDIDNLLNVIDKIIIKKNNLKLAVMQQLLTGQMRLPGFTEKWELISIADLEQKKILKLSRGKVISKKNIDYTPGNFPIYSSSIHNNGLFGHFGKYMFDEELITWSVDGGGNFFYRPRHKFSITNVCGFIRVDTSQINYRFLTAELQFLHIQKNYDYLNKAHPSVVRKEYEVKLPNIEEQIAIAKIFSDMDVEIEFMKKYRNKMLNFKQSTIQELLLGKSRLVEPKETNA